MWPLRFVDASVRALQNGGGLHALGRHGEPRLCARSMVERTIMASSSPACMPMTKDLSILSSSTGRRLR